MLIGVDFDNTIVCYDQVFHQVAVERGLIPPEVPATKDSVRNYLRQCGREAAWTELQGYVYGLRMGEAPPFPGVREFFARCAAQGIAVCVISHKTRHPFRGPRYDLHRAAQEWLAAQGFYAAGGLRPDRVYFERTREAKLARIARLGCTHFVDDLPEFLAQPGFPAGVVRILFDPHDRHPAENGLWRVRSWQEVEEVVCGAGHYNEFGIQRIGMQRISAQVTTQPSLPVIGEGLLTEPRFASVGRPSAIEEISSARLSSYARRKFADFPIRCSVVADLLARAGLRGDFYLYPLPGGANNRVFRVEVNGARALLKAYFRHAADPRDRLGAEFAFSRFAWEHGVRCLPRPLACDPEHRLGLYEFVEGRPLRPGEVREGMVQQALDFYRALNRHKALPAATRLPVASEACFSLDAHLRCVQRRVERLRCVNGSTKIEREAADFIHTELVPAWHRVADSVRKKAVEIGLSLENELPRQAWCLSPSDFGFHNALLTEGGRLRFFDFEYAGWDDPAKLVCDFFCQPAVPVPLDHYEMFVASVVSELPEPEIQRQRIALLLPVYRIKWCCILLNDFLPVDSQRRRFARGAVGQEERKVEQLRKARRALLEVGD